LKLKPFILTTLADGKPRTVGQLTELLHTQSGENKRGAIAKAIRGLLADGAIEPAAGHARAGSDGVQWRNDASAWNSGQMCRAYRLVEVRA
jgi:hypothetical protein